MPQATKNPPAAPSRPVGSAPKARKANLPSTAVAARAGRAPTAKRMPPAVDAGKASTVPHGKPTAAPRLSSGRENAAPSTTTQKDAAPAAAVETAPKTGSDEVLESLRNATFHVRQMTQRLEAIEATQGSFQLTSAVEKVFSTIKMADKMAVVINVRPEQEEEDSAEEEEEDESDGENDVGDFADFEGFDASDAGAATNDVNATRNAAAQHPCNAAENEATPRDIAATTNAPSDSSRYFPDAGGIGSGGRENARDVRGSCPSTTTPCFCSTALALLKMLPENFYDDIRGNMRTVLEKMDKVFAVFTWAPRPHVNDDGEVTWKVHVFPGAENDAVLMDRPPNDGHTANAMPLPSVVEGSCCSCCPPAVAVSRGDAPLGLYNGFQINFRAFDAANPREPAFRCLVLLTLYLHWRHKNLRFALQQVQRALKILIPPTAQIDVKSWLAAIAIDHEEGEPRP